MTDLGFGQAFRAVGNGHDQRPLLQAYERFITALNAVLSDGQDQQHVARAAQDYENAVAEVLAMDGVELRLSTLYERYERLVRESLARPDVQSAIQSAGRNYLRDVEANWATTMADTEATASVGHAMTVMAWLHQAAIGSPSAASYAPPPPAGANGGGGGGGVIWQEIAAQESPPSAAGTGDRSHGTNGSAAAHATWVPPAVPSEGVMWQDLSFDGETTESTTGESPGGDAPGVHWWQPPEEPGPGRTDRSVPDPGPSHQGPEQAPRPRPGGPTRPSRGLSERIHDAFWGYVEMVQMSALPCDVRDRIEEAYSQYGQALAEVSQPIDLQRKLSEFSMEYLRALQGLGRMEDAVTPYAALLQTALQAGLGQERLLGRYGRLAAMLLDATQLYGRRDRLESAYSQYIDVVRRAWLDEEPGRLSAEAVLDATRDILAVSNLHAMLMQGLPAYDVAPPAPSSPVGSGDRVPPQDVH